MTKPYVQYITGFLGSWYTLTVTPSALDEILKVIIAGGVTLFVQIIIKWFEKKFLQKK